MGLTLGIELIAFGMDVGDKKWSQKWIVIQRLIVLNRILLNKYLMSCRVSESKCRILGPLLLVS